MLIKFMESAIFGISVVVLIYSAIVIVAIVLFYILNLLDGISFRQTSNILKRNFKNMMMS